MNVRWGGKGGGDGHLKICFERLRKTSVQPVLRPRFELGLAAIEVASSVYYLLLTTVP
jgi:hypothetical protein